MLADSQGIEDLYRRLGYKPLNRTWAKLEIVLGLGSAALGMVIANWHAGTANPTWFAGAWLLLVLGGYLAMAGSRSHLYQSNNELTACLIDEIKQLKDRIERNEHSGR